jgi:hypothetical protein
MQCDGGSDSYDITLRLSNPNLTASQRKKSLMFSASNLDNADQSMITVKRGKELQKRE